MKHAALTFALCSVACGSFATPPSESGEPVATTAEAVGSDAAACTPGSQRCVGSGTMIETCTSLGQWGDKWACATGTCSAGACSGSTTSGPSCAPGGPGMTDCGSTAESCCASLEVTGGTYYRTFGNDGTGPTGEADPATLSGFRLDKYLVTVGRFRQFVAAWHGGTGWFPSVSAGKHAHLNGGLGLVNGGLGGGYETGWVGADDTNIAPTDANLGCDPTYATWTSTPGSQEDLPASCMNWWEAYAFCVWDGGFLPTEAEYEYAAVGGRRQREYPWGQTAPGTSNQYAIYACYRGGSGTGTCSGIENIAPVGSATRGAGRWGQLDLSGEFYEWNLDWDAPSYANPCVDCADLASYTFGKVGRGGSFMTTLATLDPTGRYSGPPTNRQMLQGFRCARTP